MAKVFESDQKILFKLTNGLDGFIDEDDIVKWVNLDLALRDLSDVPEQIGCMKDLIHLDLRENKLKDLPQNITQLTCLRWLIINKNHIEKLPFGIGEMVSFGT